MKNFSIWNEGIKRKKCSQLSENKEIDVLIIGGGITGISCLYHLMNSNLKVALVEANRIGEGVTSKTTGKLTFLQDGMYSKIEKKRDYDEARLYYQAQKEAISIVTDIVEKEEIDCDLVKSDSYLFTEDENKIDSINDEKNLLQNFGEKVKLVKSFPDGTNFKLGIKVSGTYYFHPLKYLEGLKKIFLKNKMEIYENTRVLKIKTLDDYFVCSTDTNKFVKAKKVILALHYPYFVVPFFMPFKVRLEKSYVGAFLEKDDLSFNAISLEKPVKSIRFQDLKNNKYKIFLYGSRNIAFNIDDKKHFEKLEKFHFDYEYLWSNIDIITSDYIPYVGMIKDNLYLATGYNTWGMTNGSIAGKIISDLVQNKNNKYRDLFDPLRGVKIEDIPLVLASNTKSYVESKIFPDKGFYNDVRIENINGENIGIYIDEKGVEHKVKIKCPHLGCNLVFNEVELTWDCPCHGSRFDIDGKCLEGPSNYSIYYKGED